MRAPRRGLVVIAALGIPSLFILALGGVALVGEHTQRGRRFFDTFGRFFFGDPEDQP